MRFSNATYDGIARRVVGMSANMLVPWWLMASHAYYDLDDPFLTDECYDWMCREIDARWDTVEHDHKHLIDRAALRSGTGYQLAGKMPTRIKNATRHLLFDYASPNEIAPPRAVIDIDDLLGGNSGIDDLL